ncbi:MAG: hypothetical protein ACYSX0_01080 [Planctomycetota bacterium]|jgi:hypothetical protein
MAGHLFGTLFPDDPRDFPGRRWLKMALRASHILCVGVLVGGYVFDVEAAQRTSWLLAAIISGFVLLALDVHESAAFLLQVRGLVVVLKICLLAALPWFGEAKIWILALMVFASVISSHASATVRYRVLFLADRIKGSETKG